MKNIGPTIKKICISAPSNIAFIKYWGKKGRQLPLNPSLSMTLDKCRTLTEFEYDFNSSSLNFNETLFEGVFEPRFHARIKNYLLSLEDLFPEISKLNLKVSTKNTFPHSAGIASSASAFAAIGTGLAHMQAEFIGENGENSIAQTSSRYARLGSGSASRSIEGPFVRWGQDNINEGSDEFAEKISDIHASFTNMRDCILLVDRGEKSVSSSLGHSMMNKHFYHGGRLEQANQNFIELLGCMRSGDLEKFGEIIESEALSLHALMMSSSPSFILLKPNSIEIINRLLEFREKTKIPVYYTIDAGPNIHLIYPDSHTAEVDRFIEGELMQFCDDGGCIFDHAGSGVRVHG